MRRCRAGGFTLVELLVAVAIGMALTLAITLMLTRFEGTRRSLTSTNDSSQAGAYVTYTLDRLVRSAGSGYVQAWVEAFGCRLNVARGGGTKLPRTGAFPAPFASVSTTVRLAPVVVHAGVGTGGSDVLMLQTGASGMGESPLPVLSNSATASQVLLPSTTGLRGNDLVLVYDSGPDCMVQQVASPFTGGATQPLVFSGTYAAGTIGTVNLADMYAAPAGRPAFVSMLGNVSNNRPMFQLLGVGDNATLVSHDMLQLDGTDDVVAIADGVADMRVLYGVDTGGDGIVDTWVKPSAAGWTAADLQAGTGARNAMRSILALRIAVLTRSNVPQRTAVSPASLVLFPDLAATLQTTRTLTSDEQLLYWRVMDFTVPLRNVMLAP